MFTNFVSLGMICPTAMSMDKYGLRSWAGPFDYIVTKDLKSVLYFIENDFQGFLDKENLEAFSHSIEPTAFQDRRSGFRFLHEDMYDRKEDYADLYKNIDAVIGKYQKRIKRFLNEIVHPTCFLRSVGTVEELVYISEEYTYINHVIKSRNSSNEIVFLLSSHLPVVQLPFRCYGMPRRLSGDAGAMWFDGVDEFLEFCAKNYDAVSMMRNISFHYARENETTGMLRDRLNTAKQRYNSLLKILDTDFSSIQLPRRIVIYGAGNLGKQFYKAIKERCEVICFLDRAKAGEKIGEIPVEAPSQYTYDGKVPIIVTAAYDLKKIRKTIRKFCPEARIISLNDVLAGNV